MPGLLSLANELLQCEMKNYSQLSDHKTCLHLFCRNELLLSHLIKSDPLTLLRGNPEECSYKHPPPPKKEKSVTSASICGRSRKSSTVFSIYRLLSKLALRVWDATQLYKRGKKHIWLALQVLLWHLFQHGKSSKSIQFSSVNYPTERKTQTLSKMFSPFT